jgi:hypothetical protein
MIQTETTTELEAKLFDRIRKMSIVEQNWLLQLIDKSVPETIREDVEPELSPLERRQRLIEIVSSLDDRGGVMPGVDLVAWQREQRQDRPLPGREN